jgi:putative flippase GtrA
LNVPPSASLSPTFIVLNIVAFVSGVSGAFFINERITVQVEATRKRFTERFLKFQGVNGIGNACIIAVQLILLRTFSVTPAVGNIIGAIVAYPIVYVVSMKFVWKTSLIGNSSNATANKKKG